MLTELAIRNYQSLQDVNVRFGKLTVVTGPTGSGKSSLIRAIRLVAFNARGASYIRRGAKSCTVELCSETSQGPVSVMVRRGEQDAYHVSRPVPVPVGGYGQSGAKFTKLAGQVPPQVSGLLQLSPINFAGQFDRPYLLAESAGEVARTLGQLTNVTLIFEAAREANRRKAQLAADLRQTERELYGVRQSLPKFRTLPLRIDALRRAQEAYGSYDAIQQTGTRLQALLSQHSAAQAQLDAISAAAPPVPDLGPLEAAVTRAVRLRELTIQHEHWEHEADERSSYAEAMHTKALETQDHAVKLLREAGRCPTCGQVVHADSGGRGGSPGGVAVPATVEEDAGERRGS